MKFDPFELVFVVLLGGGIGWVAFQVNELPHEAAFFPWLILIAAIVIWVVYVLNRLFRITQAGDEKALMDIGFQDADTADSRTLILRVLRFWGSALALVLGGWLIGFHVTVPLFVFVYLMVWGEVKFWWALVAAGALVLLIVLLYDQGLHIAWNDPVIWQLLRDR